VGEWERGRRGEWESGRVGEWELMEFKACFAYRRRHDKASLELHKPHSVSLAAPCAGIVYKYDTTQNQKECYEGIDLKGNTYSYRR